MSLERADEPWYGDEDFYPTVAPPPDIDTLPPNGQPEAPWIAPTLSALDDFADGEEETGTPLMGTTEEPLLSAGGMLLMYGDGGAGKTTLTLDAVAHLASSSSWLGIDVPRPCRVVMIENEGPRGMFRRKVRRKIAAWQGEPFASNVFILEEPWTRFTLADPRHLSWLAENLEETQADLCVMGPLTTLGMVGGGTPDEILAFESLLQGARELCARPFGWWIVHHENKAGDISGAWERVPDVLCHVQARGNGHTHVVWRKARWSGVLHGTSVDLRWSDGEGYAVKIEDERDLYAELPRLMAEAGQRWFTVKESVQLVGANEGKVRELLAALTDARVLIYEVGPEGRHPSARCWRLADDPESESADGLEVDDEPNGDLAWR